MKLRRRERQVTLDELEQALRQTEADLAAAEALIGPQAEAVREADSLDVDVAIGDLEEAVARRTQNEARGLLRATVGRRDNLQKTIAALRQRCLAAVQAEQEKLRTTAGDELAEIDAEIARLDQLRREAEQERAAAESRYATAWEAIEASRRRFDPAAAAAHAQHLNAQRAQVLEAARNGAVMQARLPQHLQERAEQERGRLEAERQESLARSVERNRREAAALGVTLDRG